MPSEFKIKLSTLPPQKYRQNELQEILILVIILITFGLILLTVFYTASNQGFA